MYSREYKKTFIFRFLGYFLTLCGLTATVFQFGPVMASEYNYRKDQIFQLHHSLATSIQPQNSNTVPTPTNTPSPLSITPVSTDFGIVIEKIDANARIIPNVDPASQTDYTAALAKGVAQAKGSTNPGESGNLYLFSHSVDAPWNVARYNAVFYLLRELTPGDKINIFYQNKRYVYTVFDKTVVSPSDLTFLINRYDKPVLTMQTCDPPGTSLNRLIVRAKLDGS